MDEALLIAETSRQFDAESPFAASLVNQLRQMKEGLSSLSQLQGQIDILDAQYRTNTNNIQAAFNLVAARLQLQQTNAAFGVLDDIVTRPNADVGALLSVARAYVEIGQYARSEPALQRLVLLMPDSPEIWYDLAGAQTALGKTAEAIQSLARSLQLSAVRLASDPKASNLQALAVTDSRFQGLRGVPEFQRLVAPK